MGGCASSQQGESQSAPKLRLSNSSLCNPPSMNKSTSGSSLLQSSGKAPVRDSVMEHQEAYGDKMGSGAKTGPKPRGGSADTPSNSARMSTSHNRMSAGNVNAAKSEDRASVASTGQGKNSGRSSFAVDAGGEHAALPYGTRAGSRDSRPTSSSIGGPGVSVPPPLQQHFNKMVVLPRETPVPASMLQKLWQQPTVPATLALIQSLQRAHVLRVATLEDGSTWCLVSEAVLAHLQDAQAIDESLAHALLLESYLLPQGTPPTGDKGALTAPALKAIPDDGYIHQNMAHHLIGCGAVGLLRQLLGEPVWLESKLHAYGTGPVVADFRRYLAEVPEDAGARLLLQALQLSLGCCAVEPTINMLREQMLGRLMMILQEAPANAAPAAPADMSVTAPAGAPAGPSATLEQVSAKLAGLSAGGPATRDTEFTTGAEHVLLSTRTSARPSGTHELLREWFESHSSKAAIDMCTAAAGDKPVHLITRSASLKQAGGVQRMILRGHTGPIKKVVISPNGHDVLTVSQDGTAQVWDMNVGDAVMQLSRQFELSDVAVAPDGYLAVVASVDGAACVWDLANGSVKHVLRGHASKINAVSIDKAGALCVTASDDRSVRVWSIGSGTCKAVLSGHGKGGASIDFGLIFDVALSADGCMAVTGSEDCSARIWDLQTFKCCHVLEGHTNWVVGVRFIADTTRVITASHDTTARVWDGIRGCCLHVLEGHTGRLNHVALDAAGTTAVTCSDDSTARVWDLETGECKAVLEHHEGWVNSSSVTRQGERCITVGGDGRVCVWNCTTGELQACLEGHSDALRSVVMTEGGRFAVTAGDDCAAFVWDLSCLAETARKPEETYHRSSITAMKSLPGGRHVVSTCAGGMMVVWDVATCHPSKVVQGSSSSLAYLSVSTDGKLITTGSSNRQLSCWSVPEADKVATLAAQQGSRVKMLAISGSGTKAAVLLFDSSAAVVDIKTGETIAQLINKGEVGRSTRNVHTSGVNGILLCGGDDGASTAVTWSKDTTARVWDVATASVKAVLAGHTDGIQCAALNTEGTMLASGSYNNTVRLHMVDDGTPLAVLDHAAPASNITFSPDSRYMAVALENSTVVIWDLVERTCLPPLHAHKSDINNLAFSGDSRLLATCGQDSTTRVWDVTSGKQVAFFVADAALTACSFAGNGTDILVVGEATGIVHFLDFPPELHPAHTNSRLAADGLAA